MSSCDFDTEHANFNETLHLIKVLFDIHVTNA